MSTLSTQSEAVINAFSRQPGVTADHVNNLRTILNGSPALVDQFNSAVAHHQLRHLAALTDPHAGGSYDPSRQTMNLPLAQLTSPLTQDQTGELTFVLGHELQHAPNNVAVKRAEATFYAAVTHKAQQGGAQHDYTPELSAVMRADRNDEAHAEIGGWNAVVSAVKATKPNATLQDIYSFNTGRMADFFDASQIAQHNYVLNSNLTVNPDLTMSATPANIEGMAKNYFDKPASQQGVGHNGNSDYTNLYATNYISYILRGERAYHPAQPGVTPPTIALDMRRLKLDESMLEQNGIDLDIDARHRNHTPMPYRDTSTHPATLHYFDHTTSGPHAHQYVPSTPPPSPGRNRNAERPDQEENHQAVQQPRKAPFGDPALDLAYHALMTGDDALLAKAAQQVHDSPEGKRLMQMGNDLLAQQQLHEAQQHSQQREQSQVHQGPVLSR